MMHVDDWRGEHLIRAPKKKVVAQVDGTPLSRRQVQAQERIEQELALLRKYEGSNKPMREISSETGVALCRLSKLKNRFGLKLIDLRYTRKSKC